MDRKVHKRLQNRNKLQLIRTKWMSGNEPIKMEEVVLTQLAKDTQLNKVFKLVSKASKAICDIP